VSCDSNDVEAMTTMMMVIMLLSQVIIIQFGDIVFFTVALTLEQWLWSLLFGIGDLIYAQVPGWLCA